MNNIPRSANQTKTAYYFREIKYSPSKNSFGPLAQYVILSWAHKSSVRCWNLDIIYAQLLARISKSPEQKLDLIWASYDSPALLLFCYTVNLCGGRPWDGEGRGERESFTDEARETFFASFPRFLNASRSAKEFFVLVKMIHAGF